MDGKRETRMIYEPKDFRTVIIPNALSDAINAKLDIAIAEHPDAEVDRQFLYESLVSLFDENGYIPDFHLSKKPTDE